VAGYQPVCAHGFPAARSQTASLSKGRANMQQQEKAQQQQQQQQQQSKTLQAHAGKNKVQKLPK
jgi:hypothetical protein